MVEIEQLVNVKKKRKSVNLSLPEKEKAQIRDFYIQEKKEKEYNLLFSNSKFIILQDLFNKAFKIKKKQEFVGLWIGIFNL